MRESAQRDRPRVVVFGATGYTGHLTVEALVELGIRPVIAGRDRAKLDKLSDELGGLEVAVAAVGEQAALQAVLHRGDVLIATVGPFTRYGETAIEAAIGAGAHYIDSTGEIAFARRIVEHHGPLAEEKQVSLHTTAGYDFVPGNCAAAVALDRAGGKAERVDVGYFATAGQKLALSQGTRASIVEATLAPGLFLRDGRHVQRTAGTGLRRFEVDGRKRPAISISGSEHLFLPRSHPDLLEVNTYLGWFGKASYLMLPLAWLSALAFWIPGVRWLSRWALVRLFRSRGQGPGAESRALLGSHIIAIAYDAGNRELARAELVGNNGYTFTANMMALIASEIADGRVDKVGALGPEEAFGLQRLLDLCARAGLELR